jgi:hypothetical protein
MADGELSYNIYDDDEEGNIMHQFTKLCVYVVVHVQQLCFARMVRAAVVERLEATLIVEELAEARSTTCNRYGSACS